MEEETGKFWQRDLQNVDAISKAGLDKSLTFTGPWVGGGQQSMDFR